MVRIAIVVSISLAVMANPARAQDGPGVGPLPPVPGKSLPAAGDIPSTFMFGYGAVIAGGHGYYVKKRGQSLVVVVDNKETKAVTPSAEEWRAFRKVLDEVQIRSWLELYIDRNIFDGIGWEFEVTMDGQLVKSRGHNAFPSDQSVTREVSLSGVGEFGGSRVFGKLKSAVEELIGGDPLKR